MAIYEKLSDILRKPRTQTSRASRKRPIGAPDGSQIASDSPYAHGFFSAIVAGPMVMPMQWLQRFLPRESASSEKLKAHAQSVMAAYNDVAEQLLRERERFIEATLEITKRDARGDALIDWHRGFLDAIELNPREMEIVPRQRRK